MTATTRPTDVEKLQRMHWLVVADSLNVIFVFFTFAGPVFLLYLAELSLNNAQIGVLLSLVPFCGIVAPFIAPAVARFGYKRVYLIFWSARKFVMMLMLLTPWVVERYGAAVTFYWVAGIIFFFAMCRSIAEVGGYPWRQEAIPNTIRGKYTAVSGIVTTMTGMITITIGSYVVDSGEGLTRFMILIALGIGAGLLSIFAYAMVPGGAAVDPADEPDEGHLRGMGEALRDRDFMFFLGTLGLITMGVAAFQFIPLFMSTYVGLSDGNVVLLSVGTHAGSLLSSYLWGWTADRYGSRPVMQSSIYLMLTLPLAWFLMPRFSPFSMPMAVMIAFVVGVASLAWQISWFRYLFVSAIPQERRTAYTAVYYAWLGLVSGLGPLLAGFVLDAGAGLDSLSLAQIDSYTPLFGLTLVLLLVGAGAVTQLKKEAAPAFRTFVGMFMRGNPIRALESVALYNFARSETQRVSTTARLGDAQSALSTNELLEALQDPSFNVRYEAINSLGRTPTEPRVVDALLNVLTGPESELSIAATRALANLGDPQAIPVLRRTLHSGYPLLEANSARALANLGDTESVPVFLAKLREEPNRRLRIAYASALGKLGDTNAIPELFTLMRQAHTDTSRGEFGLALARLAGDERYYIQNWRRLRAGRATAIAQAVLALKRLVRSPQAEQVHPLLDQCSRQFGANENKAGITTLIDVLALVEAMSISKAQAAILAACRQNLAEYGDSRLEFILLSLHTMHTALRRR